MNGYNSDEHIRELIAEEHFEMPAGFEDGPGTTMSPALYWWLSLTALTAPQQVQQTQVWQSCTRTAFTATADGLEAERWDIIDDWCARAFKDTSAVFPDRIAAMLRKVARLRTLAIIEETRTVVQRSEEYLAEELSEGNGPWSGLYWALDGYALFASQYARPVADRHPEVLRSAANVGVELVPARKMAPLKLGVMDLFEALLTPKRTHKRADGRQSARADIASLRNLPY